MKQKRKKQYIILGIICLVGLIVGNLNMLLVPYFKHRQELINKAKDVAEKYSQEQSLNIYGHFGMDYLVYDLDGSCIAKEVSGFSDMTFHLDFEKYLRQLDGHEVILRYDWVEITMQSHSRSQFSLVAATPVTTGGSLTGIFFLIRELEAFPHNMLTFVIVWFCIFGILFLFFFILDKKEQELDRLQRTYIAGMNHELKTPITAIKALSETLLDGYVTDPQKQMFYYSTILKEAETLEETVQELLELSRLQSTKALYQKQTVSASEVFGPVLERYSGLCEDIDIRFFAPALDDPLLPKLYTAPSLASRVLDLLLHNAVKFTESGNGQIHVSFNLKKESVVFHVRDNGCGIPADAMPHIFDRFYQAENGHNKSGSGLGLSLVREIIDGLDETVWAESTEGEGTVFSFTLGIKT